MGFICYHIDGTNRLVDGANGSVVVDNANG